MNLLAYPALATLLVVCIWGINVVVIKIGVTDMSPLLFTGLRFALLSALLIPFMKLAKDKIWPVFSLAMVMGLGHFCALSIGLSYVDSVVGGLIVLLGAPLSSLLAFIFLNERLKPLQMLAILLAASGAIAPTLLQGEVDMQLGALVILFCMLMWAVGNLQIRKLADVPLLSLQFWIGIISAPFCLLAYGLSPSEQSIAEQLTTNSILSLLYVVLGSSILAYWLWYQLITQQGINKVVNYVLLQPVATLIAGYVILGELMTTLQLAGAAVTVFAMWLFYQSSKRA